MAKRKPEREPERNELPTEKELEQLPRWARVAFAVRCARRVQPLATLQWPDIPREHLEDHNRAISLAQATAANPASAIATQLFDAANAVNTVDDPANARAAAVGAARAAGHASRADDVLAAADAARAARATAASAAANAIRRDYELLNALAEREGWTDDSPVDVALLGPLWPDGEPEGWPEEAKEERAGDSVLAITLELPEDADDDAIEAAVLEMVDRIDDMHRAEGGRGVLVDAIEIPRHAGIPKGVC